MLSKTVVSIIIAELSVIVIVYAADLAMKSVGVKVLPEIGQIN